jgi:hypothetical protein
MIKLSNLLTEAKDDKYVSIGFGRYKEKGKEKDPNAPTFKKEGDKYIPTSSDKGKSTKNTKGTETPKVNIFDKPAQDKSKTEPKADSMATVNAIAAGTGLRAQAVAGWADENGVNLSKVADDLKSKKIKPMDLMTAVVGNPGNKYAKDIISKYSQSKGNTNEPKEEPKSEPAKKRPGNPQVNKDAKKKAEDYGITPEKLGKDEYIKQMYQAAVSALTDSNYHSEARELVAKLEGKPEWAKRPEYPSMKDPQFREKLAALKQNSADGSIYMNGKGNTDEYGTDVSQAAGWDGVSAADGIAFTLRMNGFHKQADMIQSIFDNKPYMKNEGRISLTKITRK